MASIRKRSEHSYQITVSQGYDCNGKKIIKTKSVTLDPTLTPKQAEKEIQRQAVLFEKEVQNGTFLDGSRITFAEFIERWLHDYAEKQLQPKTLHRYKEMLNTRILPALGHIKLEKLQPVHLLTFYDNLKENGIRIDSKYIAKPALKELLHKRNLTTKDLIQMTGLGDRTIKSLLSGKSVTHITAQAVADALEVKLENVLLLNGEPKSLSDQTIKHHHRLISSILTTAVQWQCLLSNPAERVKPPKVEKQEAAYYDENMTEHMFSLLEDEPLKYKVMVYVTLYAGLRLGELAGLEWSDVDFKNKLLRIKQASQYLPGIGTFTKEPKNDSSQRVISMPKVVIDLLTKYKAWWNEQQLLCGDAWDKDSDFIFVQWNGKPIHPTTPTKWFKSFREKHDLPDLKFHGLRHTNASLLIGQGVDVQTVAKRLGHTKATTTTSIYSHFLRRPDQEAADKLQNLFDKKKKEKAQ